MKKLIIPLIFLLVIFSSQSFSQDQTEKKKDPVKPALLVIDIQNTYLEWMDEKDKEITFYFINAYIEMFRSNGFPVIRIYHYSEEHGPEKGTEGFEFPESIKIEDDDPKVIKTYPDAFNKTELDQLIKDSGSNTLFLTGLSAVGCVLSTWVGAQNHDYDAFLVKNAIMSHNSEYTDSVEEIFEAVGYNVVKLIVENAE